LLSFSSNKTGFRSAQESPWRHKTACLEVFLLNSVVIKPDFASLKNIRGGTQKAKQAVFYFSWGYKILES
jgi:hypothetical protein